LVYLDGGRSAAQLMRDSLGAGNQRMKLSLRSGHVWWKGSILMAAAAPRSL
jgi:hypothetical protein